MGEASKNMSQKPKTPKRKIEPHPHSAIIVNQPMVRNFSTGGGHLPGDTLVEGDDKIVTKKWQGYPPENLNVVGKPNPPMPEVAIPRFTGKAEYATRVWFPNMLFAKLLTSPHPHARVRRLDASKAEKMPGVAYILTPQNAPKTYPLPDELSSREKSSPLLLRSYLSYRLPTIMEVPKEQTNVFINSLEPRWFFGSKGFAETAIGAPPRRPRKRHL